MNTLSTWRQSAASIALVAAGFLAACAGGSDAASPTTPTTPATPQVGSVSVAVSATTLQVGAALAASAEVKSTTGAVLAGRAITWASSNTALASVTDGGTITGVAPGSVSISATSEGRTGTVALTIIPAPVNSVALSLTSPLIFVGRTTQTSVVLRDERNANLTGRTVTYVSSNPLVASVDGTGLITGVASGTAVITATSEGKSATAEVRVTAAPVSNVTVTLAQSTVFQGATTTATAVLRDDLGASLSGREITWSSSSPQVATVSNGAIVTVGVGTTTITAVSEGRSGSATLTVTPAPVATVTVTSPLTTLTVGTSTQAVVALRAADGSALTNRNITWGTSAPSVATVDNGLITAIAPGTSTITASSEGRSGTLIVTVQPSAPATVVVNPPTATLAVGRTVALTASVRDAAGNTLTDVPVNWASSSPSIANVSAAGVVTAIASGTATIAATAGGRTGTATITVQNVTAATVSLNVGTVGMAVGDVRLLVATVRDAQSNVLTGRQVTWTSSNLTIVNGQIFGDSAIITGIAPGTATITATVDGRSASAIVSVISSGTSVCTSIAGALLYGDDGQYLGRFTNRFDSQSVLNEYGAYGSPYRSTSTNNEYGTYGSPYSSLSARNPYASRPPLIVRNGQFLAYYSTNTAKSPRVSPALALSCNFP